MRDDFVAAYLIEDNGCVAFVDTGCYLSVLSLAIGIKSPKNCLKNNSPYTPITPARSLEGSIK
jgi:hypothetical protein